ncbi:flavodoxin domain-containing protein [Thetidibacter halocola]|uniref:Protoporphyrinogen oxidase n=1 Tax=Thetidibacter halocola TaxID=2827239 RepID=A0A8J7WEB5_9RHOB|nr:flavodoxin domain-containing protein [Thetidibacter halocola]MBS0124146.1 protoporphyrinogen oxidase [Thetidibacter halocola]
MTILIAYATTEGQTARIAEFAADSLRAEGRDVSLLRLEAGTVPAPDPFDAAILAGSVHAGHLQPALIAFAKTQAARLNAMPSLFLQVSLAAAGEEEDEWDDLRRIAARFVEESGWTPDRVEHVAGALNFPEYNFVVAWVMRRIARSHGVEFDPHGVTEFTDWEALRTDLAEWARGIQG